MIRAAVVGLGWWGQQIWSSLRGSERIEVVRGVDVNLDHLARFAERSGLALTRSYEEVLADAAVDAVILTTPHALHEEQVLAAAAAGKQIFCEKPLALNGASGRPDAGSMHRPGDCPRHRSRTPFLSPRSSRSSACWTTARSGR